MRTQKHRVFRCGSKLGYTVDQVREFLAECGAAPTLSECPAERIRDEDGKWMRDPDDYRDISPLRADLCIRVMTNTLSLLVCEGQCWFIFDVDSLLDAVCNCDGRGYTFKRISKRERTLYQQTIESRAYGAVYEPAV